MNKNSLFMNKLNRQELSVPTYNILGTGCRMAQGDGDGIVLRENALLDGAENTIIRGECRPLRPLHTAILDIDTYPDAYAAIQDAIDDISSASLSGASPSGRTGYHRSAASP